MDLVAEIAVKGANGGQLSGTGGGVESLFRALAILVQHPIPTEVGHIAVDIRQRHRGDEVPIHIPDADLIHRDIPQSRVTGLLQVAEKIPQIQKILVHSPLGVGLNGLMVGQKVQQQLGGLLPVVDGHGLTSQNGTASPPLCSYYTMLRGFCKALGFASSAWVWYNPSIEHPGGA